MTAPARRTVRRPPSVSPRRLAAPSRESEAEVHDLHRALRQHRQEARWLGGPETPAHRRALERALGRWRDLTLFRSMLRRAEPASLRERDRRWRRIAYARVLSEERRARSGALALAARAVRRPGRGYSVPRMAPFDWDGRLERGRRAARDALRRARRRLSVGRAHAARKELRRLGFLQDLRQQARGSSPGPRPAAVRTAVRALGELHDIDLALHRLREYPRGGGRWRTRLTRERSRLARRARRALRSRTVRRFVREKR